MCRERKVYTTSSDFYCGFVKQYFDEKGITYQEVDISRNEAGFCELIGFYGKGPLPVIVEDGRIVPINQVIENVQMTFYRFNKIIQGCRAGFLINGSN